jgi:flavin reductase (DIM6/NTAB) family NADH-FMN oxidoreductase RutF
VLISSLNADETANLAPMSSAFWLGWRAILGLATTSKTTEHLKRTGECVLNLPSVKEVDAVNRLALTTGSDPVPQGKLVRGYRHEKHKFQIAQLTSMASKTISPPRVTECPVQLEATVQQWRDLAENDDRVRGRTVILRGSYPARSSGDIHIEGWKPQSRRPRQMATSHHELCQLLRPRTWTIARLHIGASARGPISQP